MPVSSRGPRRRRSWWCHTPLIDPQHPNPSTTGRGIRCGVQTRLDRGPRGIPRGRELSSQSRNCGSLETQLTHRPADRLRPQQRPGSTHLLPVLQECHRLAGAFAAHLAQYCATGSVPGPQPRARRSPPIPHAPTPCGITPTPRAPNQLVARLNIEHQSIWGASHTHQMEALQADQQITTLKRHRAAAGRARHRPRSCENRGGRSPLIIKDLDLYPQPPTNTRSPTPNSEEPVNVAEGDVVEFRFST